MKKNKKETNPLSVLKIVKRIFYNPLTAKVFMVIICIIFILLAPVMVISEVPVNSLHHSPEELMKVKDEVKNSICDAYNLTASNTKESIIKYIDDTYAVSGSKSDLINNGSGFYYHNENINIQITFTSLDKMTDMITAYCYGTNGALSFYAINSDKDSEQKLKDIKFDDNILDITDEKVELSSLGKTLTAIINQSKFDSTSPAFFNQIKKQSNRFFVAERNSDLWIKNISFDKVEYIHFTYKDSNEKINILDIRKSEYDSKGHDYFFDTGAIIMNEYTYIKNENIKGSIHIPIYYDLSSFQLDEIEQLLSQTEQEQYDSSARLIYLTIESYYRQYLNAYCGYTDTNGNYVVGKDTSYEIFAPLIDAGLMYDVHISGLNSPFPYVASTGITGAVTSEISGTSQQIWDKILALRKAGILSQRSTMYQCTSFASYWFYTIYGKDLLKGNGNQMAKALVNDYPELFELSSSAKAGAIYSIGSYAGGNHVGCVDAIDYEKNTITISEGNLSFGIKGISGTRNSFIRIKYTMTLNEFDSYCRQICKDMTGTTDGCWVVFANPK